jgi:predicted nicotinamide N-methyase
MDTFRGYPIRHAAVVVGDRTYEIIMPADVDALLDAPAVAERFDADEYMPYWAALWPAAQLLAEAVAAGPSLEDMEILELGAGLGLVGLVASQRGGRVTISDYDADALAFASEIARRNNLPAPTITSIDWRETYPQRYDRILAADVLYEARHLTPVARFVQQHLRPAGSALIADANRSIADPFESVARELGLDVTVRSGLSAIDHEGVRISGRVYHLRHPRPPVC